MKKLSKFLGFVDAEQLKKEKLKVIECEEKIAELNEELAKTSEDLKKRIRINKILKRSTEISEIAMLNLQHQLAETLLQLDWNFLDERTLNKLVQMPTPRAQISDEHYQLEHENNAGYQNNNWLVSELDAICSAEPNSVLEIGSGNGKFLLDAAKRIEKVFGVDLARSPMMPELPDNATFSQCDVLETDDLPHADITCSADVLEHFTPDEISVLVPKLVRLSKFQYHVIACYDNHDNHLTVMAPGAWLALFQKYGKDFYLKDVTIRKGRPENIICTITNIPQIEQ